MTHTRQWKFVKHPTGPVKLDGPDKSFELVEAVLPAPKADELLVKLVSLSNDPILRNWMSPDIDPVRFYTKPLLIGDVVSAYGLAVVEKSPSKAFTEGELIIAQTGWSEKAVVPVATTLAATPLDSISSELRPTQYLSTLGMPGLTAWFSITDTLKATKDDVLLVSGAAGAVGSLAVQIAKKVIGCRKVIAIAGGASKCRWVESLGADICLDYKSASFAEDLKAVTPPEDFVTAFHDNVGGQTLQMVIDRMARHGRISACGEISSYNDAGAGIKNWLEIIRMRLVITGIVIFDWEKQFGDGIAALTKALAEGKLDVSGSEHIVEATFEEVPAVWMTLFNGANKGKLITKIS